MGMFDSLMIKIADHEVELQTKRFANSLGRYHLGDAVCDAPSGIALYFDTVKLDEKGNSVYSEDKAGTDYTVFVILVHGIFTDYQVVEGLLAPETTEQRLHQLTEQWSDTARVMVRWIAFLRQALDERQKLRGSINRSLSLIQYARRLQAGEESNARTAFLFKREEEKRLDQGENILDILESVLTTPHATLFEGCTYTESDPLADYRL